MAIRVLWSDSSESALHYKLNDDWSWDAIQDANESAYQLISQAVYPVDIILHFNEHHPYSKEVALKYAQHIALAARHYPNFSGRLFIVGISAMNATTDQMMRYQQRSIGDVAIYFCDSLAQVHAVTAHSGYTSAMA